MADLALRRRRHRRQAFLHTKQLTLNTGPCKGRCGLIQRNTRRSRACQRRAAELSAGYVKTVDGVQSITNFLLPRVGLKVPRS
jgi:hypothetical protein